MQYKAGLLGSVRIKKYRLERLLAQGGQGCVWQAHNLALDARVAIKVLSRETEDRAQGQRLLREARAAAQLGHPAIVRIFDVGETSPGDPFLVMELLEGESLADRLARDIRLPAAVAVRALLPIADALVQAHAKGIVHRDLKPGNVFLALSGGDALQPKLLDFGVVKVKLENILERVTDAGALVGSPAYLSPEQARGWGDIDERADVWSFSATLYECLTGETPFEGLDLLELLRSIVEEDPISILDYGTGDAKLWEILGRGLAKSRDERWPSMLAMGRALASWLLGQGVFADICGVSLESKWLRLEPPPSATPVFRSAPDLPRAEPVRTAEPVLEPQRILQPPAVPRTQSARPAQIQVGADAPTVRLRGGKQLEHAQRTPERAGWRVRRPLLASVSIVLAVALSVCMLLWPARLPGSRLLRAAGAPKHSQVVSVASREPSETVVTSAPLAAAALVESSTPRVIDLPVAPAPNAIATAKRSSIEQAPIRAPAAQAPMRATVAQVPSGTALAQARPAATLGQTPSSALATAVPAVPAKPAAAAPPVRPRTADLGLLNPYGI